jgi:hypothetical protein
LAKKEVLVAKSGFWEAPEGTSLLLKPIAAHSSRLIFFGPLSVSKSFDLEARKDPYVIVPCTFTPDVEVSSHLPSIVSRCVSVCVHVLIVRRVL